jgi:hypothetical protein
MNDEDKPVFIDGMYTQEPNEKVIDFIKLNIDFDLDKFWKFAQQWQEQNPTRDRMKVCVRVSKDSGKWYPAIDKKGYEYQDRQRSDSGAASAPSSSANPWRR